MKELKELSINFFIAFVAMICSIAVGSQPSLNSSVKLPASLSKLENVSLGNIEGKKVPVFIWNGDAYLNYNDHQEVSEPDIPGFTYKGFFRIKDVSPPKSSDIPSVGWSFSAVAYSRKNGSPILTVVSNKGGHFKNQFSIPEDSELCTSIPSVASDGYIFPHSKISYPLNEWSTTLPEEQMKFLFAQMDKGYGPRLEFSDIEIVGVTNGDSIHSDLVCINSQFYNVGSSRWRTVNLYRKSVLIGDSIETATSFGSYGTPNVNSQEVCSYAALVKGDCGNPDKILFGGSRYGNGNQLPVFYEMNYPSKIEVSDVRPKRVLGHSVHYVPITVRSEIADQAYVYRDAFVARSQLGKVTDPSKNPVSFNTAGFVVEYKTVPIASTVCGDNAYILGIRGRGPGCYGSSSTFRIGNEEFKDEVQGSKGYLQDSIGYEIKIVSLGKLNADNPEEVPVQTVSLESFLPYASSQRVGITSSEDRLFVMVPLMESGGSVSTRIPYPVVFVFEKTK